MAKKDLTTHFVNTVVTFDDKRKQTYFDAHTKGLALEVRKTGGKTYYFRYTNDRGRTKYIKLADAADVTLVQARKLCEQKRNQIAMGIDPLAQKAQKRNVPTFREFVIDQYLPYVKTYKRSWKTDESLLRTHLIPMFGTKFLDEITTKDVLKLQQKGLKDGAAPGSVNRRIILLRYIFNLACRDWKVPGVTSNPAHGVTGLPENNKKERYITAEEMKRLYKEVDASANPMLGYIVAFLLLTGARRDEVLLSTWEDFNLTKGTWRIPKTKAGSARYIPLNSGALRVLHMVEGKSGSDYVFGNPKTGSYYRHTYQAWNTARIKAGLPDVRLHDLRHTFASLLVNNGSSLYEVQKLLGHTQVKTTQRYAHLTQDTLLQASEMGTQHIGSCIGLPQQDHPIDVG